MLHRKIICLLMVLLLLSFPAYADDMDTAYYEAKIDELMGEIDRAYERGYEQGYADAENELSENWYQTGWDDGNWEAMSSIPQNEPLKKDERGDKVTKMQKALIQLGYLTTSADGHYGDATDDAIHAYQRDHDLPESYATTLTLDFLYADAFGEQST